MKLNWKKAICLIVIMGLVCSTSVFGGKSLVVYFSRTGEQYTVGVIDKGNTAAMKVKRGIEELNKD